MCSASSPSSVLRTLAFGIEGAPGEKEPGNYGDLFGGFSEVHGWRLHILLTSELVRSTMGGLICSLMFAAISWMSAGLYTMCWLVAIFRSCFVTHTMQLSFKSIHYSFLLLREGSPEPGWSGYTDARTGAVTKPET